MEDPRGLDRLAKIFEEARELPPTARAALLDVACGDDANLRREVELLLERHAAPGVLDRPPRVPADALDAVTPDTIAGYRILDCIGRGGMGVVYRAEQDQPRRVVAVKVMHAGLLGEVACRRFEFEAAVLARLQHPGIAQIHDAGVDETDAGPRPYFAMELVEGRRLDRYLAEVDPPLTQRLGLFAAICDAVQHAHQKGVVHRDLKPANIMVTLAGQPRILDFGVARATDGELDATAFTVPGQIVGTLAYMSPEQVGTDPGVLDTRSDVYALGVILFEMLAGSLPYDLGDTSLAGAARIITESEPTPLARLNRACRGDLHTIVGKALRKRPEDRYPSAAELAADVRRVLHHEPIQARPATALYHLGKFARRHRGLVGGAAVALLVLIVGIAAVTWQATEVAREARTRRDVAAFLRDMLTSLDPARTAGEPLTVRMMLDDAAAQLESSFRDAPRVRNDLHATVGETYELLGEYERAEHHLRLARAGFEADLGERHARTLHTIGTLAQTLRELDRLEEAEVLLVECLGGLDEDDSAEAFWLRHNLGVVLDALGRPEEAESIFRANFERAQERLGPDHVETLEAQQNYAKALMELGRLEEALARCSAALKGRRAALGDDHPDTIASMSNLAAIRARLGEAEAADTLMREAAERSARVLGSHHLHTLRRRQNVIRGALARQDLAEAEAQALALLEVCAGELGPTHAETLAAVELLVTATAFARTLDDAEALALEWHARVEEEVGPANRAAGRLALLLYNVYDSWGKAPEKALWLERVRASAYQVPSYLEREIDNGAVDPSTAVVEAGTDQAPSDTGEDDS